MALPEIAFVPSTKEDFFIWATNHASHHYGILNAIAQTQQKTLDSYALDPMPDPEDQMAWETWVETHHLMHQQMDTALNIVSNDLSELDWNDRQQRDTWFAQHFVEHQVAGAILKIG